MNTEKRFDTFTLGETMVRFTPPGTQRLEQMTQIGVFPGGAESNFAVGMARMGKRSAWFSRLPDNPLGYFVARAIHQQGVDTSGALFVEGERQGLYFTETGSSPRPLRVYYDRAQSAASRMQPSDLPLDMIAASRWVHMTGITVALSATCAATVTAAIDHGKANGATISFDVNYRSKLWSPENAAKTLDPLCAKSDMVFIAIRDARTLFGAPADPEVAIRELQSRWSGKVVMSLADEGAIGIDDTGIHRAPSFPVTISDRMGAGDSLAVGTICRLMEGASMAEALRFGTAMAALKLTIPGDFPILTRAEVEELASRGGSSLHR